MKYIVKTVIDKNGVEKIYSRKKPEDLVVRFYTVKSEAGEVGEVTKDWLRKHKDDLLNVGMSGESMYLKKVKMPVEKPSAAPKKSNQKEPIFQKRPENWRKMSLVERYKWSAIESKKVYDWIMQNIIPRMKFAEMNIVIPNTDYSIKLLKIARFPANLPMEVQRSDDKFKSNIIVIEKNYNNFEEYAFKGDVVYRTYCLDNSKDYRVKSGTFSLIVKCICDSIPEIKKSVIEQENRYNENKKLDEKRAKYNRIQDEFKPGILDTEAIKYIKSKYPKTEVHRVFVTSLRDGGKEIYDGHEYDTVIGEVDDFDIKHNSYNLGKNYVITEISVEPE